VFESWSEVLAPKKQLVGLAKAKSREEEKAAWRWCGCEEVEDACEPSLVLELVPW